MSLHADNSATRLLLALWEPQMKDFYTCIFIYFILQCKLVELNAKVSVNEFIYTC